MEENVYVNHESFITNALNRPCFDDATKIMSKEKER